MDPELSFYEIKTENGTFWIRAARASDALAAAEQVMHSDPMSIDVRRANDVAFVEPADERLPAPRVLPGIDLKALIRDTGYRSTP